MQPYEVVLVLEKLIGTSRRGEKLWPIRASRRGGEASRRGEVLWPVGLHVEVRCCDLDEQVDLPVRRCRAYIRSGVHPVVEADDGVWCALRRLGWTVSVRQVD